ncbi:major facilitator transporter [Gluconacetobacter diazotrophicus PAl 5] [Mycobacterium shimoidei]|uniref:Major facilitator transporter [Gluconacetobacter diazotrophicus PAl 5] n=1 Tax=Mycobacterium shimoidei TaxID=29313 RepID=A0A375YY37_MYCSH|nr:MFS transporter [Mycobacterium shimoidei]SRX93798.1 major facilitator transporter [Gluconacetobacter diazotrophicus PAl 5] [Mycobacterium shimoidei]
MTRKDTARPGALVRDRAALSAVNFFMADMEAGMGPFLGVLLAGRGFSTSAIGAVITLGAIVGMCTVAPAGALVDATTRKRACVIIVGLAAVAASAVILTSRQFWVVAAAQAVMCISGATIAPAVIGITLGVVGQAGFTAQNGRNQAYNHAGNMVGAALSGLLGWLFGYPAVFWLAAGFAAVTIGSVLSIPADHIDHHVARGEAPPETGAPVKRFRVLLECKPLLAVAAAVMLFWLGNAAMLPLYGLAVVATHTNPFTTVASTVVVAQGVMIITALVAMRIAQTRGYWLAILIAFSALPIRAVIAAHVISAWGVIPVQVLDGVGSGMLSVAVPGLVARILDGTGHVNVGQGAVMAAQGLGGALSPLLGGYVAQHLGFPTAFLMLGALSLGSLVIWLSCASRLRREREYVAARPAVAASPG